MRVGRKRTKDLHLLPGVREIDGRWYWRPTSKRERDSREKEGLPGTVTLGEAKSKAALAKWAEVSGYREAEENPGTVLEILALYGRGAITKNAQGEPHADTTIRQYKWALELLKARFGACRYGKTEFEASRGKAIGTADIQKFVIEKGSVGNTCLAVCTNAFNHAIRQGITTYNPCDKAVPNAQGVRDREPLEWEVECLSTLAGARMALMMSFEAITGWRIVEVRTVARAQLTADGVKVKKRKRGKKEVWEWSPELRRIVAEAECLPASTRFPASPLFPNQRGRAVGYSAFYREWQELTEAVNAILAAGITDPDTLETHQALSIEDLHFHDLRSKAHDDAEDAGLSGHDFLGNSKRVADVHYSRRAKRKTPLK